MQQTKIAMSIQTMIRKMADYFKTQPVTKAWLFGSYARGEANKNSDVDLLVEFDHSKPIGLFRYARMWRELSEILECKVDIVEKGTLRPLAAQTADREKKLIYERA